MANSLHDFIMYLAEVQKDGEHLIHYAKHSNGEERSTMPVTPFIYEFFLYNTLYSINWQDSLTTNQLIYYTEDKKEKFKQKEFESCLRKMAKKNSKPLYEAFAPLGRISLEGNWTAVNPDPYITREEGEKFFKNLKVLQSQVQNIANLEVSKLGKVFAKIEICRLFVYQVRNNIFHGTKNLGEIWDDDQRKRIEIYHLFLNCLVSSFFLSVKANGII